MRIVNHVLLHTANLAVAGGHVGTGSFQHSQLGKVCGDDVPGYRHGTCGVSRFLRNVIGRK